MLVSSPERHGPGLLSQTPYLAVVILGVFRAVGGWEVYTLPLHYGFTLIQSGLTDGGLTIQYQSFFMVSRLGLSI